MNGDNKLILDAVNKIDNRLVKLETTQQLHHEQNQKAESVTNQPLVYQRVVSHQSSEKKVR